MAFFPFEETKSGVTGALVKGDVYKPTKNGVILYFKTDSIENTLKRFWNMTETFYIQKL